MKRTLKPWAKNLLEITIIILFILMVGFACHAEFVNSITELLWCLARTLVTAFILFKATELRREFN